MINIQTYITTILFTVHFYNHYLVEILIDTYNYRIYTYDNLVHFIIITFRILYIKYEQ